MAEERMATGIYKYLRIKISNWGQINFKATILKSNVVDRTGISFMPRREIILHEENNTFNCHGKNECLMPSVLKTDIQPQGNPMYHGGFKASGKPNVPWRF